MKLKPTNWSTCPDKQRNTSLVQVVVLRRVHCLFEGQHNDGFLLLVTGRALLMNQKARNASWDGLVKISWVVILIVVSLYNQPCCSKLLMPFYARMLRYQVGARFYNFQKIQIVNKVMQLQLIRF